MNFYSKGCDNYVLAPFDEILNEEQYKRFKPKVLHIGIERDLKVNYVTHTGGIFQILPKKVAQMLLNENDELFINGDMKRGNYLRKKGIDTLYLTDYKVYHKGIDNQTEKYVL